MNSITTCIHCGSAHIRALGKSYSHAFLHRCSDCHLVFSAGRPSEKELSDHYGKYPRGASISALTRKRYREILETFEPYRRSGKLLDVGCGDGHFLTIANEQGWIVTGTELNESAAFEARKKGLCVLTGKIADLEMENDFDVVICIEVMEHSQDGARDIQKINSLLRTGGLFYFTTPNFNSLSRYVLGGTWKMIEYPEHLTYYTAFSVSTLLGSNGFKKISLRTTGISFRKNTHIRKGEPAIHERDQAMREQVEGNFFLRMVKLFVNALLSGLRLGETIKGTFVKT